VAVRALARVNLAAIERNVRRLRDTLQAGTEICVVVKADGYGHGAAPVARAAQAAGAAWLAVASAQEAAALRGSGLDGPLLVMGAISSEELPLALAAGADVVAWTADFVRSLRRGAETAGGSRPAVGVHVKFDTGMGRFGTRELEEALSVAAEVAGGSESVMLRGAMTHLATADDDPEFLAAQLARFEPFVDRVRERWPGVLIHAANSAAALRAPESHFGLVRCGIAVYGCNPMGGQPEEWGLDPALELTSYVAALKTARPGDSVGYGRTFRAEQETCIATVPIGYADGYARALSNRSDALIAGQRHPVVGTISMDNLTVDVGADPSVRVGDRVTLIGTDGPERQTAEALAQRLGSISWEILCGISERVPRQYHRDGEPA
jgi:alanine racemase